MTQSKQTEFAVPDSEDYNNLSLAKPFASKCKVLVEQDPNKGWNARNLRLTMSWMRRSQKMTRYLTKRMQKARMVSNCMNVSYIILSTLCGSLAFVAVRSQCSEDGEAALSNVIIGFLGMVAALLASLKAFFDPEKKIAEYKYSLTKFGRLARHLESIISSNVEDRPDFKEFSKEVNLKIFKYQNSVDQVIDIFKHDWEFPPVNVKEETNREVNVDLSWPTDSASALEPSWEEEEDDEHGTIDFLQNSIEINAFTGSVNLSDD